MRVGEGRAAARGPGVGRGWLSRVAGGEALRWLLCSQGSSSSAEGEGEVGGLRGEQSSGAQLHRDHQHTQCIQLGRLYLPSLPEKPSPFLNVGVITLWGACVITRVLLSSKRIECQFWPRTFSSLLMEGSPEEVSCLPGSWPRGPFTPSSVVSFIFDISIKCLQFLHVILRSNSLLPGASVLLGKGTSQT